MRNTLRIRPLHGVLAALLCVGASFILVFVGHGGGFLAQIVLDSPLAGAFAIVGVGLFIMAAIVSGPRLFGALSTLLVVPLIWILVAIHVVEGYWLLSVLSMLPLLSIWAVIVLRAVMRSPRH